MNPRAKAEALAREHCVTIKSDFFLSTPTSSINLYSFDDIMIAFGRGYLAHAKECEEMVRYVSQQLCNCQTTRIDIADAHPQLMCKRCKVIAAHEKGMG